MESPALFWKLLRPILLSTDLTISYQNRLWQRDAAVANGVEDDGHERASRVGATALRVDMVLRETLLSNRYSAE